MAVNHSEVGGALGGPGCIIGVGRANRLRYGSSEILREWAHRVGVVDFVGSDC